MFCWGATLGAEAALPTVCALVGAAGPVLEAVEPRAAWFPGPPARLAWLAAAAGALLCTAGTTRGPSLRTCAAR